MIGSAVGDVFARYTVAARDWSDSIGAAVDPLVRLDTALDRERGLGIRVAAGDRAVSDGLRRQAGDTDATIPQALSAMARVGAVSTARAPAVFADMVRLLPQVRRRIDGGQISVSEVDQYYSRLAAVTVNELDVAGRKAPDAGTAAKDLTAGDIYFVADQQSRATAVAASGLATGHMAIGSRVDFARLAGSYRQASAALVPRLNDAEQARFRALTESRAWQLTDTAEATLTQQGTVPVPVGEWLRAADQVTEELSGIWSDQLEQAVAAARSNADRMLTDAIVAGCAALSMWIVTSVIAVWLSTSLVRRLRALRDNTLEVAQTTLPELVRRAHDGEQIDTAEQLGTLDPGRDEIGQVARAFRSAQQLAINAATTEAKTRSGVNQVFLAIAHRSQVVAHRQLELLDKAEKKQDDPQHLEVLFKLDHLTTRARRNAENLLILGGGQAGRKWREPVPLEQVVRSAVSETERFARVRAVQLPELRIVGGVVADLIHLLAELVDNATAFSPPEASVAVRGNVVGKGVVVEIEDQGLGIEAGERERINETLRNPPDFQTMAVAGEHQLGLFVVGGLAARHAVTVNLQESVYGGILAIVVIPNAVIADEESGTPDDAEQRTDEPEAAAKPETPVEVEQVPVSSATTAPPQSTPHRPELPRRSRSAGKAAAPVPVSADGGAKNVHHRPPRKPEEARAAMSSLQEGTRRGRDSTADA